MSFKKIQDIVSQLTIPGVNNHDFIPLSNETCLNQVKDGLIESRHDYRESLGQVVANNLGLATFKDKNYLELTSDDLCHEMTGRSLQE